MLDRLQSLRTWLRPEADGAPFPGTELPSITEALRQAETWIEQGFIEAEDGTGHWLAWPDQTDFVGSYGTLSLNTGLAGVLWYLNAALAHQPEHEHSQAVRARIDQALGHLEQHWDAEISNHYEMTFAADGFYGGLAGIGVVLGELAANHPIADRLHRKVLDEILARQGGEAGPNRWSGISTLLGEGGIIISLLDAAERTGDDRYRAAALRAGEEILREEKPSDVGSVWPGVDPTLLGLPEGIVMEGFETGHTGVSYVLARLAIATGDERYAAATNRALAHVNTLATVRGDAAVFERFSGGYSFGYCTGSSGMVRAYVAGYRATGNPEHLEWALRYGRGMLASGVPARSTPGNIYLLHQCCGSAAVLESFIGLYLETRDDLWLEAARAQAEDLLIRSVADERGRRWYSEAYRLPVAQLKAEVGHQTGASGIALALLHLQQVEDALAGGTSEILRLPDDPFRSSLD